MKEIPSDYRISKEKIKKYKKIAKKDYNEVTSILKTLSNHNRIKILKILRDQELCVCVLIKVMNLDYSKMSYHLKKLQKKDLITNKKEGKFSIYKITKKGKKTLKNIKTIQDQQHQ
ncbi:MAG: Transcriptional regulator containing HTH domain, ArsR family [Candidatus Methanohalarchaeum thermophilum]|uniref:Transcriptional regulator containing HTH domain, ArsR family n=1 Tax=Methanohalarchaeum thermophilum TaxID=1903181 RepID=A0A1Q6DWR6_METT1|nr:MAG: Transcriptional regulator containing HTH domain, ArsR family [Candidatus Methanohalarchaeum thermophilum]